MQQIKERKNDGFNLRLARKWRNMTQDDVAMLIGVLQTDISKYERMEQIDDKILKEIAEKMNVPFDFFTDFDMDNAVETYSAVNNDTMTFTASDEAHGNDFVQQEHVENKTINNNPNSIDEIIAMSEKLEGYALKLGKLEEKVQYLEKENAALKKGK